MRGKQQQGGYVLVATMLALVVLTAAMGVFFRAQARNMEITQASGDGTQIAQFAGGLRGFIAAVQADPTLLPAAPQPGVAWLKPTACGGLAGNPIEGYVPCSYTGGPMGALLTTTFVYDAATNFVEARTAFVVPARGGRIETRPLTAERIVQAAMAYQQLPAGVFFSAYANTPVAANAPVAPAAMAATDAGRVVMVASNAPSNDIYLRTDGTNRMLANLNMGGMSIGDARDGRFTGDVRIEGRAQMDQGLTVQGPTDLRGGAVISEIALTSVGKYASEGFYNAQVLTGALSYTVPKPDCSQAGNNPGIYAAIQGTGTVNQGAYAADALYSARVDVTSFGSNWTVRPVVQGTRFDLSMAGTKLTFTKNIVQVTPMDQRVLVMTRCR